MDIGIGSWVFLSRSSPQDPLFRIRPPLMRLLSLALVPATLSAAPLADWDFTTGTHGWTGNRMVENLRSTPAGLAVTSTGNDPWLEGPPFDAPENAMLRVTVEMQTRVNPAAHIFYGRTFSADRCQAFPVTADGQNHSYTVMIPRSTGPGTRLRLDPCAAPGKLSVRRIRVEALHRPEPPNFAPPSPPTKFPDSHRLQNGELTLQHHPTTWNALRLQFGRRQIAAGYDGEMIGAFIDGKVEYLRLNSGNLKMVHIEGESLGAATSVQDSQDATWTIQRNYTPGPIEGSIDVETIISVDRDREAVLLPWFTILPGHGSHGSRKHQGLFAGLEYLADEPSSSKADLTVPAHVRKVPDPVKITFPLMAIQDDGVCLGLVWNKSEPVAAGFDSPDRAFGSKGHAMWLSGPAVGEQRFENDLVAHSPVPLKANTPFSTHATLVACASPSVAGAVQQYLALRGLPKLPEFEGGFDAAVDLLAHGWLDSAGNEDWRFRHAVWMDKFSAQPAAGAAMFQSWLGTRTSNKELAIRLEDGIGKTLSHLNPGDPFGSAVSHVRHPVAPLLFGRIPDYVAHRRNSARNQLRQFDDQGRVIYRPREKDYATTHFTNHANGLGGRTLTDILEAAVLSADEELADHALAILDKQAALYAHSVPRGAQTWEMPLHTPDILASAHMIRAYVYGHILTGNDDYLEHARYWAWTGVPFIYLVNPSDGACGPYATIGVLGATNWVAPNWIGQPVQWCGLVYASALHLLAGHDQSGPWTQLARGITLAGLQMTWPTDDEQRQGLLPDFFHLRRQVSDGPAINPGTVGAHLPEAFEKGSIYSFRRFPNGWTVHAPCPITDAKPTDDSLAFSLGGWGDRPYHILVAGVKSPPSIITSNQLPAESSHHPDQALLIVLLKGPSRLKFHTAP